MISVSDPNLIRLDVAASRLPKDRAGRHFATATLIRWATRGCRGVVLETIRLGQTRFTTAAALDTFSASLARVTSPARVTTDLSARAEAECRDLERMGL